MVLDSRHLTTLLALMLIASMNVSLNTNKNIMYSFCNHNSTLIFLIFRLRIVLLHFLDLNQKRKFNFVCIVLIIIENEMKITSLKLYFWNICIASQQSNCYKINPYPINFAIHFVEILTILSIGN